MKRVLKTQQNKSEKENFLSSSFRQLQSLYLMITSLTALALKNLFLPCLTKITTFNFYVEQKKECGKERYEENLK